MHRSASLPAKGTPCPPVHETRQPRIVATMTAILLLSILGSGAEIAVFGPQSYSGTGQPVVSRRTFSVAAGGSGYVVRVRNDGVNAALVVLNGRVVLCPSDFSDPPGPACNTTEAWDPLWNRIRRDWRGDRNDRTRTLIEKPVTLRNGSNEIIVAFISRVGTSFTLEIVKPVVDTTAPVITTTTTPPRNAAGWNNANVLVTFICSDAGSGIATCPPPVTVSTEGANQVVTGPAAENAGNKATATVTRNIDKTAPVVTATPAPAANANGWNNTPVVVSFAATDALSGVNPASVTTPVTLSSDGANLSATGQATDLAGNVGTATKAGINIDRI